MQNSSGRYDDRQGRRASRKRGGTENHGKTTCKKNLDAAAPVQRMAMLRTTERRRWSARRNSCRPTDMQSRDIARRPEARLGISEPDGSRGCLGFSSRQGWRLAGLAEVLESSSCTACKNLFLEYASHPTQPTTPPPGRSGCPPLANSVAGDGIVIATTGGGRSISVVGLVVTSPRCDQDWAAGAAGELERCSQAIARRRYK